MTTTATPRKSISIYDYPEHLNPFREEDKSKFWTIGRKLKRSNSITFPGLKDIRNSWALRSFMRKGKKKESSSSSTSNKSSVNINGEPSPVVFRRAIQYSSSSTLGVPTPATRSTINTQDRYVYGGSVTPLPRSRFQERMRSPSQQYDNLRRDTFEPHMAPGITRSDITGSRLSVESTNPFDEDYAPVPPVRASRRKKKRAAPPPPTSANSSLVNCTKLESSVIEDNEGKRLSDVDIENLNLGIELKIVEDEDVKKENKEDVDVAKCKENNLQHSSSDVKIESEKIEHNDVKNVKTNGIINDSDNNDVKFPKVDIITYRRNSSINENDFKHRRENRDFPPLAVRSKSLNNATNNNLVSHDINLNINIDHDNEIDSNGNAKKVVCKYNKTAHKQSIDTISSTEKEFIDIDMKTKEIEHEISKLNLALNEEESLLDKPRSSITDIKKKFDGPDVNIPNLVPKPKRSNAANSPINTT